MMKIDWVNVLAGLLILYGIVGFIFAVCHFTPTVGGTLCAFLVGCLLAIFKDGM